MGIWERKKIKDFAFTISGGTPSTSRKDYWEDGTIPWINSGELSQNHFIKKPTTFISDEALRNSSAKLMPIGTVVVALTGATTGMSALLLIETSGNQSITGIFPSKNHDSSFLLYLLQRDRNKILGFNIGSAQPHINKQIVDDLEFLIPKDVIEQSNIAEIISAAGTAIEQTEALIAKYQCIKTGLMQDILTKGIDEHGIIRSKATHKFVVKNGIEVPKEWEVVELNTICKDIADRDHTTPKYVDDGFFIVSPKDFNVLDEIDFSKCLRISKEDHLINRRKTNIEVDDLIFTRIGAGLGKICKVISEMPEFSILHSACMIKPNQQKVLSDYLLYYIKSEFAQKQIMDGVQSIGVPDLGMDKIRKFFVKLPKSIIEQQQITNPIISLDNLLRKERQKLQKLNSLKAGLMEDLLSGKLRVNLNQEVRP
jgi:type I restriction enzyme S subunit